MLSKIFTQCRPTSERLELVIEIFRHGARQSLLENKQGPLTEYGKAQQYILGQELRTRYVGEDKLLSPKLNKKELRLHSSPKKRAVESLKWQVSGLYPFESDFVGDFNGVEMYTFKGVQYEMPPLKVSEQTIEVLEKQKYLYKKSPLVGEHKKPPLNVNGKDMFYHAYDVCKSIIQYHKDIKHKNNEYLRKQDYNSQLWEIVVDIVNNHDKIQHEEYPFNKEKPNLMRLGKFLDLHACNIFEGNHIQGYTPEIVQSLRSVKQDILNMKFQKHEKIQKICVTEHLMQIADILMSKFQYKEKYLQIDENEKIDLEQLKMMIYSCHDRNLYLLIMNLVSEQSIHELGYDFYVPPFASAIIFEIISTNSNGKNQKNWNLDELFLEIKLNDVQLEFKYGYGERISMKNFLEDLIPKSILVDYKSVCHSQSDMYHHNDVESKKNDL